LIEETLALPQCKRVLCWLESAKVGLLRNLDCSKFEHKIEVVYRAIRPKQFAKVDNLGRLRLLFVGSGYIPGEFENKGGREVLAAFALLRQRLSNLELTVRADVPPKLKSMYRGLEGLTIIDHVITRQELDLLFRTADVFLMPAYHTPGMAILEAMAFELPVLTINSLGNAELVTDGETGFVVPFTDRPEYYVLDRAPNPDIGTILRNEQDPDRVAIAGIVEKISFLASSMETVRGMGRAARWEVEYGRFSISARNRQLAAIFDRAIESAWGA
jgi:glycosyltransferase involved in cell wall biosynthesis